MTNTSPNLWVHVVKQRIYILRDRSKYVITGDVVNFHGATYGATEKVDKVITLQDFYKMYGESIDHLKMLYPEINWMIYKQYLEEKV